MTVDRSTSNNSRAALLGVCVVTLIVCSGAATAVFGAQIGGTVAITLLLLVLGFAASCAVSWLCLHRSGQPESSEEQGAARRGTRP